MKSLRNTDTNTINKEVYEILSYLFRRYGKVTPEKLQTTEQEVKENGSSNQLNSELNLKVVELTEEENKSHKEYLLRMKEETGTDPLGLN